MEEIRYGPPLKLYDLCINVVLADCTSACKLHKRDFRSLPNTALADFYERLFQDRRLCILAVEFSQLDVIHKLLYVKGKRLFLLNCYQILINHGTNLNSKLLKTFHEYAVERKENRAERELIEIGLLMGNLLNDGGWFDYSIQFLNITETMIMHTSELGVDELLKLLECYRLRLYAESHDCRFSKATETYGACKNIIRKLKKLNAVPQLARIFTTFSIFKFSISAYDEAYIWSQKALKLLSGELTKRVITEVLRQASKACVVKRKFAQAGFLIGQALNLGEILNSKGQVLIYSDILMDYGFYLLSSDSILESVLVYEKALKIRTHIFEKDNIHLAKSHEDLAYALYVQVYSSGHFWQAKEHAEKSIEMLENILPSNHLLLASVNRVKALILEEMALDDREDAEATHKSLLTVAENLHITALRLSKESLGENNVQTAKHFGNLGRLYQSMNQFDEAERMHLKAIAIKEKLLGPKDYEVGLSIGHLASLYNYHMKKYKEAEKLYLRSIEINFNLFGPAYSGFEYDYRGLINVYHKTVDPDSALYYHNRYREWKQLRENIRPTKNTDPLLPPKEIVKLFFELGVEQSKLQEQRSQLAKTLTRNNDSTNATESSKDITTEADSLNDITSSLDLNDTLSSMEIVSHSDLDDWDED